MLSTGFTDAPVSRSLVYGIVAASILASITDVKHYFYIQVDPHLWRYHQIWRIFAYQLCYTNSTEVLFAAMTLYNMRVIERLWGSRKYAVRILSLVPQFNNLRLLNFAVFHPPILLLHNPPPTNAFSTHPPPPLVQHVELPPRGPHAPNLRHTSPISRRHPPRLQIPSRGLGIPTSKRALRRPNLLR